MLSVARSARLPSGRAPRFENAASSYATPVEYGNTDDSHLLGIVCASYIC
jgi:hypothetical protein